MVTKKGTTSQPKEKREFPRSLNFKDIKLSEITCNEDGQVSHPELTRRYLRAFVKLNETFTRHKPVSYIIDGEEFQA